MLAIFAPLLAVWAVAARHLSDPANRADAMPPTPSGRRLGRVLRAAAVAFDLSLVPSFRGALRTAQELEASMRRLRETLARRS